MFAGVPCYNLKALYGEIADQMPEPRSLLGAWQEMRQAWEMQKTDPDYYFDVPVPPITPKGGQKAAENLEASIGELAPKGLQ